MKVLIWDKGFQLASKGGPIGYMFNIHEYLKIHKDDKVFFYSDVVDTVCLQNESKKVSFLRNAIHYFRRIRAVDYLLFIRSIYFSKKKLSDKDLSIIEKFDYVHVHHLPTLMTYFSHANFSAKVIYTTHFPEPLFDEITTSYGFKWILTSLPFIRNYFHKKEADAIRGVGHVMLPVVESVEVYVNQSAVYKKLFDEIIEKIFYVPTAIYPEDAIITTEHTLLTKYDIPKDALKICYIGRHNKIKGYDKLREIAIKVWESSPNTWFIIGGKEEPMKGIKDKRWIELGWVNTFALLNEIDVFILPNQQTFFDLILIEVLRQGIPCIISNTGGNKWFEQFNLEGVRIFDYNKTETAVTFIETFRQAKEEGVLSQYGQSNHNFFLDHLTVEKYINNYINRIESL